MTSPAPDQPSRQPNQQRTDLERAILLFLEEAPEFSRRYLFSEHHIAAALDEPVEAVVAALAALESAALVRLTRSRTSFGRSAALLRGDGGNDDDD